MEITLQTVQRYRKKLLDYLKHEKPFKDKFTAKTYILDMMYFMALAIDEKKFYGAQGFDLFKGSVADVLDLKGASLEFSFKHSETGETKKLHLTESQVREMIDADELTNAFYSEQCKCEPLGETNVVDCACPDYLEFFELVDD